MNPRYQKAIDVFFLHTSDALDFGRRQLEVTIVGYGEPGQPLLDAQDNQDIPEAPGEPSFLDSMRGRLVYLSRLASVMIGARDPASVNRYDVDCLTES